MVLRSLGQPRFFKAFGRGGRDGGDYGTTCGREPLSRSLVPRSVGRCRSKVSAGRRCETLARSSGPCGQRSGLRCRCPTGRKKRPRPSPNRGKALIPRFRGGYTHSPAVYFVIVVSRGNVFKIKRWIFFGALGCIGQVFKALLRSLFLEASVLFNDLGLVSHLEPLPRGRCGRWARWPVTSALRTFLSGKKVCHCSRYGSWVSG